MSELYLGLSEKFYGEADSIRAGLSKHLKVGRAGCWSGVDELDQLDAPLFGEMPGPEWGGPSSRSVSTLHLYNPRVFWQD